MGSRSREDYNKIARLKTIIATLLDDPVLADVPKNASLADIDTLISVDLGSAMKLSIVKMDNTIIDVAVPNNARLRDLKVVVEKKVNAMEQAKLGHRHISWRHVWKNYCFCYLNQKLIDDFAYLQGFGIKNNCQISFVAHVATKEQGKHSRAKKRRFFHGLSKQA